MNFPYTTLPGIPRDTKRPLIPIKFIYKDKSTLPILCLDSGADYSYLSMKVAKLLEIDLSGVKPHKSFGVNGSPFSCYQSKITIELEGQNSDIPAQFSSQLNETFPCILGQRISLIKQGLPLNDIN